jgi:dihydrofolate synthase / folylpolyglutamate synthase
MLSAILRAAGYRVGTYTSPHVFDIRERVLIDGEPISQELFVEGIAFLRPIIERLTDTEYGQTTEFEIKTALAFWAFEQTQVDITVLEVGVGGRLDATNVIVPEVSVIVSIGLDHQDRLGPTHRDIAYEKAGIIKPGRPVVSGAIPPDAVEMIAQVAAAQGAPLARVRRAETAGDWRAGSNDFLYMPLPCADRFGGARASRRVGSRAPARADWRLPAA